MNLERNIAKLSRLINDYRIKDLHRKSKFIDPRIFLLIVLSKQKLRRLMKKLGFIERIKGSHHIYFKDGIPEIINLQDKNGSAKSYQV